jgi:hypothetical protein
MKSFLFLIVATFYSTSLFSQEISSPEIQIKQAQMVLLAANAKDATVFGYNKEGVLVTLKKGTNELICLADDPFKSGFSVAAYHQALDPYMARGRALKKEGKKFNEIFKIRGEEINAGLYNIPDKSTLYVMTGEFDENQNPTKTYLRYVIYVPFATAKSTGLPTSPVTPGGPWIMDPDTYRAHIMINPKNSN